MKIVFTGGGTGGHFYPVIAVAEKVNQILAREKIIGAKLYYISTDPYDKQILFENKLEFRKIETGKLRTYFSVANFFDLFKTFFGVLNAVLKIFFIYPDVIFAKGGYASFPVVFAAKILRIPLIVHESDFAPGRVNVFASSFAKMVALSYKESSIFFTKPKVKERLIYTGQPIRKEIEQKEEKKASLNFWKLGSDLPVLLILGGSQGAELINQVIIDALPKLVEKYQVIHQTGVKNFKNTTERANVVLDANINKARYTPKAYLNSLELKMAAGAADIIISRAGSQIFEIASWGIPSILIPITNTHMDHQKKNAFAYARAGACVVIEELNLKANIIYSEVERITGDPKVSENMSLHAKKFYKNNGAEIIAEEIIKIALSHEK
jgi:UDP-N-acetylglucosamine--N-acetylmuramyl-(pentapeptide) pyrophosphoryl-undecaprenol N-acetylglucosamine transferase